jgi:3,4-dihydroxy 2-butanone 4-phosphate synthase/GTP cyclohydrolase II
MVSARRLAESSLPTEYGGFRVVLYDNPEVPAQPHFALVSDAAFDSGNALVRVHSECLTGETLGSRKCDCGAQLRRSMRRIAKEGGVLVYLRQEGRGIGLPEKIRAYALQDMGFDTVEANLRLGHEPDERDFSLAAAILADLGVRGVRVLTNNPEKIDALRDGGIVVRERVPLEIAPSPVNHGYLAAKKNHFGHLLEFV